MASSHTVCVCSPMRIVPHMTCCPIRNGHGDTTKCGPPHKHTDVINQTFNQPPLYHRCMISGQLQSNLCYTQYFIGEGSFMSSRVIFLVWNSYKSCQLRSGTYMQAFKCQSRKYLSISFHKYQGQGSLKSFCGCK